MPFKSIAKGDLKVGMYVELNLSWFDHPFPSSKFLIKDQATLKTILGLKKLGDGLQWDPERSRIQLESESDPDPTPKPMPLLTPVEQTALDEGRAQMQQARRQINQAERKVAELGGRVRNLMPNLTSASEVALEAAADIAAEVCSDLVSDPNAVMQLINVSTGDDSYFARHAINVTALSVMLARASNFDEEFIEGLGVGAFLHDIGVTRLPASVYKKKIKLSLPEQRLYDEHAKLGAKMTSDHLPRVGLDVVKFHHARWDGSGLPAGLKGEDIPLAAQIVAIANRYDNLCNPRSGQGALSPSAAVKFMFSKERAHYNPRLLDSFIRCLGVYPPGTMVALSDDQTGVVVTSNPDAPLSPRVVVYDPMVERRDAVPLDLTQPDMPTITGSYRLDQLPDVVGAYLALSAKINYYLVSAVDKEIMTAGEQLKKQLGIEPDSAKAREIIE